MVAWGDSILIIYISKYTRWIYNESWDKVVTFAGTAEYQSWHRTLSQTQILKISVQTNYTFPVGSPVVAGGDGLFIVVCTEMRSKNFVQNNLNLNQSTGTQTLASEDQNLQSVLLKLSVKSPNPLQYSMKPRSLSAVAIRSVLRTSSWRSTWMTDIFKSVYLNTSRELDGASLLNACWKSFTLPERTHFFPTEI